MKLPIPKPNFGALADKGKGIVSALRAKLPAKLGGGKAPPVETGAPADDVPDHLKPTFLERKQHLLPVVGAYSVLVLLIGGISIYLMIAGDDIEAELIAQIPKTQVAEFTINDLRTSEAAPSSNDPEDTAGSPPTDDAETASAQEPARDEPEQDVYAGNLAPHPDPGLVEEVEAIGLLPIIGADGRLPWQVYARPSSSLETRPRIAVVVMNLGLSTDVTEAAIALPGAVTLSFSPYAPGLEDWIRKARDAGHEVLIGLPMEPRDFPRSDAGVLQLMTTVDSEQNTLNLRRILSGTSGYIGVTSDQGSGFTANRASVQPVMQALAKRGLVYFDTLQNATSVAPEEAGKAGAPFATADVTVDSDQSRSMVRAKLAQLELLANTQGTAVIAVEPFPMPIDRLEDWARDLGGKGLVLTPLSGVITARARDS